MCFCSSTYRLHSAVLVNDEHRKHQYAGFNGNICNMFEINMRKRSHLKVNLVAHMIFLTRWSLSS